MNIKIMLRNLMAVALCGYVLTGCNTIAGAGEDIESAGNAIEHAAED
ncbi:MAG: entericidin A/B family lipoprotein [Gammaproteobacteria bacterium]|nr:entericidin A/B family lipoprotein [Gammaproteobacteria bacterium]